MAKFGSPSRLIVRLAPLMGRHALQAAVSVVLVLAVVSVASALRAAAPVATVVPVAQVNTSQDLNGDGRVDAVFTQKQRYNQVCFGDGSGRFTSCSDLIGTGDHQLSNQINTTASALVDMDGDGDLDIVLAMEQRANVVCFNDGAGQFNTSATLGCVDWTGYTAFPYNSQDVVVGHLNGDGLPDLVFANGGNAGAPLDQPNLVCLGGGGVGCVRFGSDAASTGVALGDVDGDGDLDVLVSNLGSPNEVCLNAGNGTTFDCRPIPQASNVSATKHSNAVAVGHLAPGAGSTPDAHLDVVFANNGKNEVCFGNGNWSGTVGLTCQGLDTATSYLLNDATANTVDVVIADIMTASFTPGAEIIFANTDAPNVRCYTTYTCGFNFNQSETVPYESGGTIFMVSEPIVESTTGVAVRDININGRLDVVVANTGLTGGVSRTYIGAGFSSTTAPVANSTLYPTSITLSGGTVGPSADTAPPAFIGAANRDVEATGPTGALVTLSVTAQDVVDGTRPVTCNRASGSLFALGNTTVTCTASDLSGNLGTVSFVVSVVDTTGPVVTVPANMSVLAPAGQTTTAVAFVTSAFDIVDGPVSSFCYNTANNFGVLSGAQFAGGTTTLMCYARDARNNNNQTSFTVTVITDIDSDGILDDVDLDDDGDGIADIVDSQPIAYSSEYAFDATNTGTVVRNGWTVSIVPTPGGSLYDVRATLSGAGTAPAIIEARCGFLRKELRLGASGDTIDWKCIPNYPTSSLSVNFVSGTTEFWKATGGSWIRITATVGGTAATAGSPVTADAANTAPLLVTIFNELLTEVGSFSLDAGESVAVDEVEVNGEPTLQLEVLNGGSDGTVAITLFGQLLTLQAGGGPAMFGMGLTCAAGSYLASPIDMSCTLAPPGKYVAAEGAMEAIACAEGTYQPEAGQTSCLNAPLGMFVDTTGAIEASACPTGTFSDVAGAAVCQQAPAGTYVDTVGAAQTTACAVGTYQPDAGQTACLLAPAGTAVSTQGAEAATVCPVGRYQPEAGQTTCLIAPLGTFVGIMGAIEATTCTVGTFSDIEGAAVCQQAPAGTFVDIEGAAAAVACAPGTYQPNAGQTACLLAPAGTFVDTEGATEATLCPVGTVSDAGATACTNTAPTLAAPANQTLEATSIAGATATFAASGSDVEDGALGAVCLPASGSTFALGTTTVNCTVTDNAGALASATFTVHVVDTTAPSIAATADISVPATSAAGAVVTYSAPATTDLVNGTGAATCAPASGLTFPVGTTMVTCTASDAAGNTASATFTVTVAESLSVEDQIRAIAGSGADQLITAYRKIATAPNANAKKGRVTAYQNQVNAQLKSGKITAAQAAQLRALVN